ncbi:hypothetical protein [Nocardioides sp. WS12]|uniref:hypothetical protein n=1 Tax=Nocardioides sp. WS12 TaxID=2486272 RepID=UPI0015F97E4D|nr:hypothetical protein [Nocardioides sp. WS12]
MKLNKYVGGSIAALATAAVVVSSALPAHAEPVRPYAAAGSDTTQDVWNGLTNDGGPLSSIASYDAFDGTGVANDNQLIKSKSTGTWFVRPSGSGNGVKALSGTWDSANHIWKGKSLVNEEIDMARSSSGPSGANDDLTYVPMGRDAVSIAFNTSSGLPSSLNLSTSQIQELYRGVDDNTNDGAVVVAITGGVPTINGITVDPKIPQSGSGTRSFFLSAIGGQPASWPSYITEDNLPENNGSAIPNGGDLIPFSVAQWIAQHNVIPGIANSTTASMSISSINAQAPTTGTSPNLAPGALYGSNTLGTYGTPPVPGTGTFNRDVYDVIPTLFTQGSATPKQGVLVTSITATLSGAAGTTIVKRYGFGKLGYLTNASNYKHGSYQH